MSHLLLVEDDDDLREDFAAILEYRGYEVRVASNGAEALADLQHEPKPCLIILDLMMPVMDGWQFRQLQLTDPALASIPVVVTTGIAEQTAALQVQRVLTKPIRLDVVLSIIAQHCTPAAPSAS